MLGDGRTDGEKIADFEGPKNTEGDLATELLGD